MCEIYLHNHFLSLYLLLFPPNNRAQFETNRPQCLVNDVLYLERPTVCNKNLFTDTNSPLVPVLSLSLFAIASGFLMSLIPLALESRGMAIELAPWLASIFYAGLLGGTLISSRIVAKIGHRYALMAFLSAIAITVFAMMMINQPIIWLTARLLAGISVAGIFVVIESWLLMADNEKSRAKRLGMYMTSLYGGTALGQLGIGVFGTTNAFPLMVVITLLVLAIFPPILFKKGRPPAIQFHPIKFSELKHIPSAAYLGCIVSGLVLGAIYGLLPLELEKEFEHEQVGSLMAVAILGGMLVQPVVSWLNSRVEKILLMALFCFVGLLAIAMIEIATVTAGMMAGLFLLGAAAFALYPVAITLACRNISTSQIVAAAELMLLSYSIGSVIGPVVAGFSMQLNEGLMIYFAVCFAATLIFMLINTRRNRRQGQDSIKDQISLDL